MAKRIEDLLGVESLRDQIIIIIIIMSLYNNCRQTLQRTIKNICHAGQYILIEYTQSIHVVQHVNVSSHTGALGLLNAVN